MTCVSARVHCHGCVIPVLLLSSLVSLSLDLSLSSLSLSLSRLFLSLSLSLSTSLSLSSLSLSLSLSRPLSLSLLQARGEANAYSIQAKAEAEAEAMQKQAEAFEKYGSAAMLDLVLKTSLGAAYVDEERYEDVQLDGDGVLELPGLGEVIIAHGALELHFAEHVRGRAARHMRTYSLRHALGKGQTSLETADGALRLYEFEGCPYCRRVREVVTYLDLVVDIYPCAAGSRHRAAIGDDLGAAQAGAHEGDVLRGPSVEPVQQVAEDHPDHDQDDDDGDEPALLQEVGRAAGREPLHVAEVALLDAAAVALAPAVERDRRVDDEVLAVHKGLEHLRALRDRRAVVHLLAQQHVVGLVDHKVTDVAEGHVAELV